MPGAVGIGLLLLACAYALTLTGGREVAGLRPDEAAGLAAAGGAVLMVLNGVGNRFRSGFGEGSSRSCSGAGSAPGRPGSMPIATRPGTWPSGRSAR